MNLNIEQQTVYQRILTLLDKLPLKTLLIVEQLLQLFYEQSSQTDIIELVDEETEQ
jgi:hypothetical protein